MKLEEAYRTQEHHYQKTEATPFAIDLLRHPAAEVPKAKKEALFPSTYRTELGEVRLVKNNEKEFLEGEFSVPKLDSLYEHLWLAGLPVPPRPLHYQLVLQREIVVCEKMDVHLVWGNGRIHIKPIPWFLLSPAFWETNLQCAEGCDCSRGQAYGDNHTHCKTKTQRTIALGFLFTYTALISSQHDFHLAQEAHLIPSERSGTSVNWTNWQTLVEQILTSSSTSIYENIHRRFHYGELRANRLNAVSLLTRQTYVLNQWPDYSSFIRDQLGWLAATTIYIALALSAMQVGLATERLEKDRMYMAAAYGFSVFAIIGPIVGGVLIVCVILVVGVVNWRFQRYRARQRFRVIMGAVAEPRLRASAARQGLEYRIPAGRA